VEEVEIATVDERLNPAVPPLDRAIGVAARGHPDRVIRISLFPALDFRVNSLYNS